MDIYFSFIKYIYSFHKTNILSISPIFIFVQNYRRNFKFTNILKLATFQVDLASIYSFSNHDCRQCSYQRSKSSAIMKRRKNRAMISHSDISQKPSKCLINKLSCLPVEEVGHNAKISCCDHVVGKGGKKKRKKERKKGRKKNKNYLLLCLGEKEVNT